MGWNLAWRFWTRVDSALSGRNAVTSFSCRPVSLAPSRLSGPALPSHTSRTSRGSSHRATERARGMGLPGRRSARRSRSQSGVSDRPHRCSFAGWKPPGCAASEVEAGGFLDPLGGDGVHVALAQDDQVLAVHLDLVLVLGGEEHLVADLHLADAAPDAAGFAPHQPLGHLGGRRDEDAAAGATVAVLLAQGHEDAVVQHLDRQLAGCGSHVLGHAAQRYPDPTPRYIAIKRGSAPAELVQPLLRDAEVVRDLVDDGDRDLLDDVVRGLTDVADRLAVDHDPVRQLAAVLPAPLAERDSLVEPEQIRLVGIAVLHQDDDVVQMLHQLGRHLVEASATSCSKASTGSAFTSWSVAGGPPRNPPRSAPPAPRARAAARSCARRHRYRTTGRRRRSGRSGPPRPDGPGRGTSATTRCPPRTAPPAPVRTLIAWPSAPSPPGPTPCRTTPCRASRRRRARHRRSRRCRRTRSRPSRSPRRRPAPGRHRAGAARRRRPRPACRGHAPRPRTPPRPRTAADRRRSSSGWCTWRRGRRRPCRRPRGPRPAGGGRPPPPRSRRRPVSPCRPPRRPPAPRAAPRSLSPGARGGCPPRGRRPPPRARRSPCPP